MRMAPPARTGSVSLWSALLVGDEDASLRIIGWWDVQEGDMNVLAAGFPIFDERRGDALRKRALLLWGPASHPGDLNVGHTFLPKSDSEIFLSSNLTWRCSLRGHFLTDARWWPLNRGGRCR